MCNLLRLMLDNAILTLTPTLCVVQKPKRASFDLLASNNTGARKFHIWPWETSRFCKCTEVQHIRCKTSPHKPHTGTLSGVARPLLTGVGATSPWSYIDSTLGRSKQCAKAAVAFFRVHSVHEKSLKMLEFTTKLFSRPLKTDKVLEAVC